MARFRYTVQGGKAVREKMDKPSKSTSTTRQSPFARGGPSSAAKAAPITRQIEDDPMADQTRTKAPGVKATPVPAKVTNIGADAGADTDTGIGGEKLASGSDKPNLQGLSGRTVAGLSGSLHDQFMALDALEGVVRDKYTWNESGQPKNPAEAALFLSQARGSEANELMTIMPGSIIASDVVDTAWLDEYNKASSYGSRAVYLNPDGSIVESGTQLHSDRMKLESYRDIATGMLEDQRQEKRELFNNAITHGYDMKYQQASLDSQNKLSQLQIDAQKEIAAAERALEEQLATKQRELTASEGAAERAVRKDISASEIAGRKDITRMQGSQALEQIKAEGNVQMEAMREKHASDRQILERQIQAEQQSQQRERETALLKIERESEAQGTLLSLDSDLEMERESFKQQFQKAEAAKDRALQTQNLEEYRRAALATEQLQRDRLQLEREGQSLQLLMSVSSNPALLYYMKQSGMLAGAGESILGQNVETLINDLSASIDPTNLPNIQTYNAMSELEQQIAGTQAGATQGMSQAGMQDYLQGTSPFTRGQRSSIRIGSERNPFEALG
tara:strand:- start:545 stop:2233 length:1689 start_codon:yes stop_codon:yes gene_type:complete